MPLTDNAVTSANEYWVFGGLGMAANSATITNILIIIGNSHIKIIHVIKINFNVLCREMPSLCVFYAEIDNIASVALGQMKPEDMAALVDEELEK